MTIMYGVLWLISMFGLFFNLLLVYITIKSKSLHGRCNFLLAFNSLTVSPLLLASSVKFIIFATGINFIPLRTCFILFFVPLLGAGLATSAQLCIGIDRLIGVLFPIWYKYSDRYITISAHMLFCLIRGGILNYYYFYAVGLRPEKPVRCASGDMAQPEVSDFVYRQGLVLFISEFLCYFLVWLIIICKKSQSHDAKIVRKLMKSLTVIMSISFFCYIQGNVWRVILPYLNFKALDVEYFVSFPTSCLYNIAFGSNLPILVIFSIEYRAAFKKHFWACGKKWAHSVSVTVQNRSGVAQQSMYP